MDSKDEVLKLLSLIVPLSVAEQYHVFLSLVDDKQVL